MEAVQVPQNQVAATLDEIYRQKGEVVTQMEICQGRLQVINQQLQQLLSQAPIK